MSLSLNSDGITNGVIDDQYGKRSNDLAEGIPQVSFPLEWKEAPIGTKSFAVVFVDYDNVEEEGICWIHWLIANIPSDITFLSEDASRNMTLINDKIVQGRNTWTIEKKKSSEVSLRYGGPLPTSFTHEYEIKIYALNKYLNLEEGFTYNQLLRQMRGSILEEAALYATYNA